MQYLLSSSLVKGFHSTPLPTIGGGVDRKPLPSEDEYLYNNDGIFPIMIIISCADFEGMGVRTPFKIQISQFIYSNITENTCMPRTSGKLKYPSDLIDNFLLIFR